jgi:hypothetical protein
MNKNYIMLPRYTIALVKEKNLQGDYKTITESAQAAVVIRKLLLDQDRTEKRGQNGEKGSVTVFVPFAPPNCLTL